jgi:heme/copper-type cytochrome/quinol oxidase subunit 2
MVTFKRWGWTIAATVGALLILFIPLPQPATTPVDRHMRIEASMFAFTPAEWTINPEDRVTVELVSTDVVHGFSLDGYNFELKADPGQTATGTFVANQAGLFRFRCSVPCGNLHPFMIGKLQVGSNLLFIRGIALGLLSVMAAIFSLRQSTTNPALRLTQ